MAQSSSSGKRNSIGAPRQRAREKSPRGAATRKRYAAPAIAAEDEFDRTALGTCDRQGGNSNCTGLTLSS